MGYPRYGTEELEALVAAQRAEIDVLASLLGAVYPYIGFPFDPYKARAAWIEFGELRVTVEETLALYPGMKADDPEPGNVSELPPWRRPRRPAGGAGRSGDFRPSGAVVVRAVVRLVDRRQSGPVPVLRSGRRGRG